VSKVSALRKLGVLAQVAQGQARRSRTLGAVMSGVRATLRSFADALRQLWHEVMGTVFLAMAFFGGIELVREYMKFQLRQTTASRLAIAACFTLAFGWFGVSSFWRVRRKSQRS